MARLSAACLVYTLVTLLPAVVAAEWPSLRDAPAVDATGMNDVAVIVAVEDYVFLPPVPGAIRNAADWEVFLEDGLQVGTVYTRLNNEATREEILKVAQKASKDVGKKGTIWWIFIGHGAAMVDGKDGLLVGVDAQQTVDSLEARGVAQGELLKALGAKKQRSVVIVDACFSGRSTEGDALAPGVQPVVPVGSPSQVGAGSVVLSAAKSTQVAGQLRGEARPAFSYLLLGAMRGWADDGDGEVTVGEAVKYVKRQLRGVVGREQTPQATGDLEFVLTSGTSEREPRVVAEGVERRIDCPDGTRNVDGECVSDAHTSGAPRSGAPIRFKGRKAYQEGERLKGADFYLAIDRPDLAAEWKSHTPAIWVTGIGVGVAAGLMIGLAEPLYLSGAGVVADVVGFTGLFAAAPAAIALIVGGLIADKQPMNRSERREAAHQYNRERGLSASSNSRDRPPRVQLSIGPTGVGATVRF